MAGYRRKPMTDTLSKVVALRDDLSTNLLERDAAINAAVLALVTREHALFLGPPGTAKSLLVRAGDTESFRGYNPRAGSSPARRCGTCS
jgi:MoxR-like ATPase